MSDPTPPVTPAAYLADEAAHERVARAIHAGRFPKDPDAAWTNLKVREDEYKLAKLAIDAWHAGQPSEHVAYGAIALLASGLRNRDFEVDASDPQAVASRALGVIDNYDTALVEATRDFDELDDDGLSTDQEIRARALDVAGRKFGTFGFDTEELLECSETLAGYIRDGRIPPRVSAEERSDDTKESSKIDGR